MKVMTILGTRPEIIKMAVLNRVLKERAQEEQRYRHKVMGMQKHELLAELLKYTESYQRDPHDINVTLRGQHLMDVLEERAELRDLQELAPMEVSFGAGESSTEVVPVSFETVVTETGMLQLWCVARDGRRWKLEFNVREKVQA